VYFRDNGTLRFADASGTVVAKANDPEHAHRLAACWNAFLQAETTEIERIDDGLWDMNDVLLAGTASLKHAISFPEIRALDRLCKDALKRALPGHPAYAENWYVNENNGSASPEDLHSEFVKKKQTFS
jgi:hypothetical protein